MVRVRPDGGRLPFAAPPLVRRDVLDESDITLLEKALKLDSEAVFEGRRTDNGPGWMALLLADAGRMLAAVPPNAAVGGFAKVWPIDPNSVGADAGFEVRALTCIISLGEDPVMGSLNAAIAQLLIPAGKAPRAYTAVHGTKKQRRGRINVEQIGEDIWVGKGTVSWITGTVSW